MNLIIDIGNTRAKIAVYKGDQQLKKRNTTVKGLAKSIKDLLKKYPLENCILSSVSNFNTTIIKNIPTFKVCIELNHQTNVPFKNHYNTPSTLGVDRIALISAAAHQFKKENCLIIDAGTCITYDFIDAKNNYLGGAISPGIGIRYKSLHQFTAKLPKLEKNKYKLIGKDTNSAIHSGVLNGMVQEVEGIIAQYKVKYQNLTVILTGGDTNFLAKKLKSTIFANPNFLLEGLNSILIHNLDE